MRTGVIGIGCNRRRWTVLLLRSNSCPLEGLHVANFCNNFHSSLVFSVLLSLKGIGLDEDGCPTIHSKGEGGWVDDIAYI